MDEERKVTQTRPIEKRIVFLRGERVMLSTDLAALYGVEPRALVQAVKRNLDRFPEDFMFQLTREELGNLKSQFVISSWGGLRRASPYAFTEHGVAMLSSVLRGPRAVRVNVEIMRAFVRVRRLLVSDADLARKLADLERKYDAQFKVVFDAIRQLMAPPPKPRRSIGFKVEEGRPIYRRRRLQRSNVARK
jgi:hypothetical protein